MRGIELRGRSVGALLRGSKGWGIVLIVAQVGGTGSSFCVLLGRNGKAVIPGYHAEQRGTC